MGKWGRLGVTKRCQGGAVLGGGGAIGWRSGFTIYDLRGEYDFEEIFNGANWFELV